MSELRELPLEKFEQLNQYWSKLGPREMSVARSIVDLLKVGSILEHEILERGNVPLLSLRLGEAVRATGRAEMLEYGPAYFEGEEFADLGHSAFMGADVDSHLVLPTWQAVRYERDHLRVEQISGFVDFDNPCVETEGNVGSSTSILRLLDQPKSIRIIFEE